MVLAFGFFAAAISFIAADSVEAGPMPNMAITMLGVVWIGVVGVLLAGVVALNVAVLRLNVQLEELARERNQLRADNAQLSTEIAARAASGHIVSIASDRLGLAPATPENWTYLDLRR